MTTLLAAIFPAHAVDLPPETYYQGTDSGLDGDDQGSGALPIGFTFNFFGNDYTELYASSNGFLSFTDDYVDDYGPYAIPDSDGMNNYISPFGDDLTVYSSDKAKVYYKTIGTAPNRKMVVQWTNVYFYDTNIPVGTFQVILYEGSNEIQLQYRYIITTNSRALGDSATVGIENADGSAGVEFSNEEASLSSGKVISFIPEDATYTIKTNADYDAILLGGGATDAPAIPTPSCPPHQGEDGLQPLFAWLDAANADSFRLIVDDENDFDSPVIEESGIIGSTYTPTSALTDGQTYYWAVISENATDSSWSEQQSFTTNGSAPGFPPCTPLLSTPLAQARAVSTSPTFSWQAAVNADYYQLIVSTKEDLSDPVFDENNISTTSKTITGLDEGPIFYWKVIAHNTYGGTDSSIRNFTTADDAPIAPSALNATLAASTGQIDLQWTDNSNNEQSFVISYANTSGGPYTEILVATSDLSSTGGTETYSHTGLTCGPYYYLIKARNGFKNDSANTSEFSVTIPCTSPSAINLTPSVTSLNEGETLSLDGSFTDPDLNESHNITIDWGDGNNTTFILAVDVTDFSGKTHSYADNGTYTITVTVSDGTYNPTQTTDVTVNNVAPTITEGASTTVNMDEDGDPTPFSLSLNATDAGTADSLTWSISSNPSNGTANVSGTGNSPTSLDYTPNANYNGSDSFVVQVSDDDGDTDTITVNITVNAVNDAPTNTVSDTQATNEDTPLIFSTDNSNLIEISDIEAEDALGQPVTVTLTATNGTLTLSSTTNLTFNNGDGTDDTSMEFRGSVTDINTALAGMSFTPTSNYNGSASVQIVINDGTSSDEDTINITINAVNDIPTSADNTVTLNEDATYTFTEADFEFSDVESGNSLNQIKITQLPTVGTLQLDGVDVTIDQVIAVADISKLTFTPAANANGNTYATFQFKVHDGTSYSDAAFTMTIDVTAVNDAPTTADKTITLNEDEAYTFAETDFEFTDIDTGNSLNQIKITQLPTVGTLQLDAVDVTIDQVIVAADISKLIFTPAANANGNTYATFKFKVFDGTSYSDAAFTMTIDVTAVNDLPSFTKGDDQTVFVNAEQNIAPWASNIDAGSANESSQTLNFIVTNDNNSLFSAQPAIDASGNLTFTASAVGNAIVTVALSDGIDTSAAQTFNIKVNELPPPPRPSQPTTQQPTTPEPTGCSLSSSINCTIKNEGTITDVKIEPEGSVEGGTLEGEIKNEGTLKDVTLAEGTKIDGGQIQGKIAGNPEAPAILINVKITAKTELSHVILDKTVELPKEVTLKNVELRGSSVNGGKLEGTIRTTSSATVIENVSLGENTNVIGGKLAGTISGTSKNPAILEHLTVEPQTQLTDVIISDGVEMPADVNLAIGVRFTTTENIPNGVDLTQTLPSIIPDSAEVEQPSPVDLSNDPIINGIGLLAKINRLQEIIATSNQIDQNNNTGFLTLKIETTFFAVIPMKVQAVKNKTRASTEQSVRLGVGQRVYFTTEDDIEVIANPAVQDLKQLKTALAKLNLPTFKITEEGNIKIPATETIWYSARPDLASTIVAKDTASGFITKQDGNVALIFENEKGEKLEQIFYPSPADMSALEKFDLTPKGILEIEIKGKKIKGRLDYKVEQGKAISETIKVTEIPDSNGDVLITYPDGTEQRLFGLAE